MKSQINTITSKVDGALYSRQLYVYGESAMENMTKSNVLICGINGVGLDLAKCLILSGVNSVTLHDCKNITNSDRTTNYYISESDIGKNRAVVVADKLAELNPYVKINVNTDTLSEQTFNNNFSVVVFCDGFITEKLRYNKLLRDNNIKFIVASTYGLMGFVFCDFGNEFIVNDSNGEQVKTGTLVAVENGNLVSEDGKKHDLDKDDIIEITTSDKIIKARVTKKIDLLKFSVESLDGTPIEMFNNKNFHLTNTSFTELKQPVTYNFKPLDECLKNPEFMFTDVPDPERPYQLHLFNMALSFFVESNGRTPKPWNDEDANEIFKIYTDIAKCDTSKQKDLINKLSYTVNGNLCAIDAVIGSIAAQEVLKGCTKKFSPIKQWMYFDQLSMLPDEKPIDIYDNTSRYESQILIFGKQMQQKLTDAKIFVVGAGAIGCEHLKNFSMSGIGNIVITDMDTIEKSNLSRQFLFRNKDIGKTKSETAVSATKVINPEINLTAHLNRVGQETLSIYNEEFFRSLSCVANALDNVQARLFVDQLCVNFGKPLLESGTLGTKGNIQTIIPHMTESYGSTRDPPEQGIPVCTLKNFPYDINHTIQYARDMFEGYFNKAPMNYNKLVSDKDCIKSLTASELAEFYKDVILIHNNKCKTSEDAIEFAYREWHEYFRDQIKSLLDKFPEDHKTNDGILFWSGTKRCPKSLVFDNENENHVGFVLALCNLWGSLFNLPFVSRDKVVSYLYTLNPPVIGEKKHDFAANEEEEKKRKEKELMGMDTEEFISKLSSLSDLSLVKPIDFEKDDDTNYHIDFVTYTSNMRAQNYSIPPADKFKTKGIAGKIIPAIATTTSLVSGLVTMELFKVLMGYDKIDRYRNSYINLGIPFVSFFEPTAIRKTKIGKLEFTIWDNFRFKNQLLAEFVKHFESKGLEISSISCGSVLLTSQFLKEKTKKERFQQDIITVYKNISGDEKPSNPLQISVIVDTGNDDEDVEPVQCMIEY